MEQVSLQTDWIKSKPTIFWGEISPCDHVVQIYDTDDVFLDALSGFLRDGFAAGESCIVIATRDHLSALHERLQQAGLDISALIAANRYIPRDADETLSQFMVNGWPDEKLFNQTVSSLFDKVENKQHNIRAFGEMVALLWARGLNGATVHLEYLWNNFQRQKEFSLFCAYPKTGFTGDLTSSLQHICNCHSKMIAG